MTGIAPFKAPNYKQSMYKNYKCEINFDIKGVSPETLFFLRQLVARDPRHRLTAERALEHEALLKLEMDEMNSEVNILSAKLRSAPMMYSSSTSEPHFNPLNTRRPQMKTMTDEKQETQVYSKIDSRYLQSAHFRFENSNEASSVSQNTFRMDMFRNGRPKNSHTGLVSKGAITSRKAAGPSPRQAMFNTNTPRVLGKGVLGRVRVDGLNGGSMRFVGRATGLQIKDEEDEDTHSENFEISDQDNPLATLVKKYR